MNEPACLWRDVTDEELASDLDALRAGDYPHLQYVADSGWSSTRLEGAGFVLGRSWTIWLRDQRGEQITVTLHRLRHLGCWRRDPRHSS